MSILVLQIAYNINAKIVIKKMSAVAKSQGLSISNYL